MIVTEYYDICLSCEHCIDDDEALYCNQEECKVIEWMDQSSVLDSP